MDNPNTHPKLPTPSESSRRTFLHRAAGAVAGTGLVSGLSPWARVAHASGSDIIRIGLVGCGGRGSGAATQALRAEPNARLVAMADAFSDRLQKSLQSIQKQPDVARQIAVDKEHQFVGFDGYAQLIASDVDVVLLATPPHFRPMHLKACIDAGKHVFAEKPVAVDAPGVRSVLQTTEEARKKNLCIVSGLNTRYSPRFREFVRRIHAGAVGELVALHAVRYAGGVWVRPRQPDMTDMEYQMRNWYYFTWLSGDFNVEQFIHQMDMMAWLMQQYPTRCYATGGRQVRTGPDYGQIYDHFSTVFECENGVKLFTTTRHQRGCSSISNGVIMGDHGSASLSHRNLEISGVKPWKPSREPETDSHQLEHNDFFAALRNGNVINNGSYMAKSTLMAIMSRQSAYTGQTLTWEQMLNSKQDLSPKEYTWGAVPPDLSVALPGVTKFI